jgi:diaminopropionate ammonia-lyase
VGELVPSRYATQSGKEPYINPDARSWRCRSAIDPRIVDFHRRLPGFTTTPLISLDSIAAELGVKRVFIKDESNRMGLPAFKILGASWATYRAILRKVGLTVGVPLEDVSVAAQEAKIELFTAIDGNHGRAVARMAKLLGITASIFTTAHLDHETLNLIASEGAQVIVIEGDYDSAVQRAKTQAEIAGRILIQDTAFRGYEETPQVCFPQWPRKYSNCSLRLRKI